MKRLAVGRESVAPMGGSASEGSHSWVDEATPMLADDWQQIKAAHNGMISIQNRIRLFIL